MAAEDFDLPGLADYLHLDRALVAKLAERGELPSRRVAGEWRFSPAEITRWLEIRIGASADAELKRVEGALNRSAPADEDGEEFSVHALLVRDAIEIPLAARTRNSAIESMVELAGRTGWLWDEAKMAAAVRDREEMQPTALENGVALLHPRRPLASILERPFLALGKVDRGIPFGGSKGVLTDIFFLILSTDDRGHLRALARLSRLIGAAGFLSELRAAANASDVLELIDRHEGGLSGVGER